MKKYVSIILVLFLVFSFTLTAIAAPKVQNFRPTRIMDIDNGAYLFVKKLVPGTLEFTVGWNNGQRFEQMPQGYRVILYNVTNGTNEYLKDTGNDGLKRDMPRAKDSFECEINSGEIYLIEFKVIRWTWPSVEVILEYGFTAP